ncbi:MAG TPA: radical SAM protein [Clostridia bacterium]|nr:radical SAM protein [Clostridia bacterium]
MNYKASQYNVTTNFKEYVAIHNLISHKGFLLSPKDAVRILDAIQTPAELNEGVRKHLTDTGILIDGSINEADTVRTMRSTLIEKKRGRLSLTIIPTYQCNFKCIYCWENTKQTNDSMSIQTQRDLLAYIKKRLATCTALDIDWFGGEPLLAYNVMHDLLEEIACLCRTYRVPYSSTLTTNGYCLTPEIAAYLAEHNNYFFQITLDGPRELHNFNRPLKSGKGTYDVIFHNLTGIRDSVANRHIKVFIRINVTNDSAGAVEEMIPLIGREFGGDSRFYLYIQAVERHNDLRFADMEGRYLQENSIIERLYDRCIDHGIMTTPLKMLRPGDLMCKTTFYDSVFISSDGSLYKCDMAMTPDHVSYIGSLQVFDADELKRRNDSWYKHLREAEYCTDCILYPLCFGMKCPYYSEINVVDKCEYYNDYVIVKSAVKSYAQQGKYPFLQCGGE